MRLVSILNLDRGDRPLPPRIRALSLIYIGMFLALLMLHLLLNTSGFLKKSIPGTGTIVSIKSAWRSGKSLEIKYSPRLSVITDGWLPAWKGNYSLGQPVSFLFDPDETERLYNADFASARIPNYLIILSVGLILSAVGFIWLKKIEKRA
jgi:hypothetical protein